MDGRTLNNNRGVCFVRFDDNLGPCCIYSKDIDEDFQKKVVLKSHLSTLSLVANAKVSQKDFFDSIIPFPDENYIAYSTYFYIKDKSARGGNRTFGIVLIVEQSEQMNFYKSIPEISANAKHLAKKMIEVGDSSSKLHRNIKEDLEKLMDIENLQVEFADTTGSLDLIKQRISAEETSGKSLFSTETINDQFIGSFDFLFQKMASSLDCIINTLLLNERILVVGRHDEIVMTMYTLREFLPHKRIYNDPMMIPMADAEVLYSKTEDTITLHILGLREESIYSIMTIDERERMESSLEYSNLDFTEFLGNFPITSKIVIDFYQGKVFGGESNSFCVNLLSEIKDKDFDESKRIIKTQINSLLENTNQIREIFLREDLIKSEIDLFLENIREGEMQFILKIIEDVNPRLKDKILSYFSQEQLNFN